MPRLLYIVLFLLEFSVLFAQQKQPVKSGVITLTTGKMIGFTNLQFIEDKVLFYNDATRTNDLHTLEEVSLIADDSQNTVYKGQSVKYKNEAAIVNDTLYRPNYPQGIYKTKDDFLKKKPSSKAFILPVDSTHGYLVNTEHNCYFIDGEGERLKNVFAVSFQGHLYFQVNAIAKYKSKTDRAQSYDVPYQFVRVILGGDNYFYTEADMTNVWAQGLMYAAGQAKAGSYYLAKSVVYGKGIVWDIKNSEFNIFKNCKDYNKFIEALSPQDVQNCTEHMPNLYKVRKAIEKVK